MLQLIIPASEQWDEAKQEFVNTKEQTLQLEHSLISLSNWESKWHKPFLSSKNLSVEEILDYIRCMTINKNVDPNAYTSLSQDDVNKVTDYINAPMTATTFSEDRTSRPNREIITAELIYYWMIALNIPVEFQKWHLNRLLTLIRVCNIKNSPPKKMSRREIMSRNAALNAARRKQLNSRG